MRLTVADICKTMPTNRGRIDAVHVVNFTEWLFGRNCSEQDLLQREWPRSRPSMTYSHTKVCITGSTIAVW